MLFVPRVLNRMDKANKMPLSESNKYAIRVEDDFILDFLIFAEFAAGLCIQI